jgi:hypothetical protein
MCVLCKGHNAPNESNFYPPMSPTFELVVAKFRLAPLVPPQPVTHLTQAPQDEDAHPVAGY